MMIKKIKRKIQKMKCSVRDLFSGCSSGAIEGLVWMKLAFAPQYMMSYQQICIETTLILWL